MKKIPNELLKEYEKIKNIYNKDKENLSKHLDVADFLLDNEQFELAIDEYLDVLLLNQNNDLTSNQINDLYIRLGICYIKTKEHQAALECFAKCNHDEETLSTLHESFRNNYRNDCQASLMEFFCENMDMMYKNTATNNQVIEECINNIITSEVNDFTLFTIGKMCFNNADYSKAVECFTLALEKNELSITRYFRALANRNNNKLMDSLADVKILLNEDPEDLDYLFLKAQLDYFLLEYEEAYEQFINIQNTNHNFPEIHFWTACVLFKLYSYDKALVQIDEELQKTVSYNKLYLKSKILFGKEQYKEALLIAKDAQLLETNEDIIEFILSVYLQLDLYQQGLNYAKNYVEYSQNVWYSNYIAKFNFCLKNYNAAIEHYKPVLGNKNFHQDRIHFNCGYCYEMINDIDKAKEFYNKSLEINPNNIDSIKRLEKINEK